MMTVVEHFVRFGWAVSLWIARLMGGLSLPASNALAPPPSSATPHGTTARRSERRRGSLDPSVFTVIGDGLAAGMGDFSLDAERQRASFPARLAAQMGVRFTQRLIEPPGLGDAPGFPRLPVRVPAPMQSIVIEDSPDANRDLCDFTVPGLRIAEVSTARPCLPLVRRDDATQTAINLIFGLPEIRAGLREPSATLLDRVLRRRPTIALIALGFDQAMDAAAALDPDRLAAPESTAADYGRLIRALREVGSRVVVTSVPDPLATAYFSPLPDAAAILRTAPGLLEELYQVEASARISVPGLVEIGNQLLRREPGALSPGSLLDDATASRISARVHELNRQLEDAAACEGAWYFDLARWLDCFARRGIAVGNRVLTARYLGGFYSLNGYYPGATGHAAIANALLDFMNAAFGASFPPVHLGDAVASDAVAMYEVARGPLWTRADLPRAAPRPVPDPAAWNEPPATPSSGSCAGEWPDVPSGRLTLPPGLVQTLPVCTETSYFGEAIRAVDCTNERESTYGSCARLLFNGLLMADSHLRGRIRIRFTPPDRDVTHFELTLLDGLDGDDGTLAAPLFYEFPFVGNRLMDFPGTVSSGDLNLATGEVTNLRCSFAIATSGLMALAAVNPAFPRQAITFPGQYGSAWARFTQRRDGLLDVAFFGTTFLPLGAQLGGYPVRFPLPFGGPSLDFATLPARGSVMHPHVCLNTSGLDSAAARGPDLPQNTIREYTLFSRNSSFGDHFTLNVPELGDATGRSHLLGRAEIQFGPRSGSSVPIAITLLGPGGLLQGLEPSAITEAFPGRLSLGPLGHDEFLRFPLRTYFLEGVSLLEDPFDISVGAVDRRTGRLLTELLHRGFLDQDVFLALLRVEPRTPRSSFLFRGPARFEGGADGGTTFRFKAHTIVPYPAGFLFPQPDLAAAFTVGPNSVLDPFLWLRATEARDRADAQLSGGESNVVASNGDVFSYAFSFDAGGTAHFEYTNATQQGAFRLHSLAWIDFARARGSNEIDTVSFSGFGVWSKGDVHATEQASVHISTIEHCPYVGILIGGGAVSNVNTKPALLSEAVP